jgi:hypothetical protein
LEVILGGRLSGSPPIFFEQHTNDEQRHNCGVNYQGYKQQWGIQTIERKSGADGSTGKVKHASRTESLELLTELTTQPQGAPRR